MLAWGRPLMSYKYFLKSLSVEPTIWASFICNNFFYLSESCNLFFSSSFCVCMFSILFYDYFNSGKGHFLCLPVLPLQLIRRLEELRQNGKKLFFKNCCKLYLIVILSLYQSLRDDFLPNILMNMKRREIFAEYCCCSICIIQHLRPPLLINVNTPR